MKRALKKALKVTLRRLVQARLNSKMQRRVFAREVQKPRLGRD
jgi:hypothetical protein